MTDDSEETRELGVEFGTLSEALETESYPITGAELLDKYGDHTLGLEDGTTSLQETLEFDEQREFEDSQGVRQTIFAMVDTDAVGREEYSDRGGTTPSEGGAEDTESL